MGSTWRVTSRREKPGHVTQACISRHDGAHGLEIVLMALIHLPSPPTARISLTPTSLRPTRTHRPVRHRLLTTHVITTDGAAAPMLRPEERGGPCALERRRLRTRQAETWRREWYVIAFVRCLVERAIEEGSEQPAISLSAFGCAIGK